MRVKLERVSKYFGEVPAVVDLTLEIKDKSFTVLLGPSGSGKTTVLNMIAGLEKPTSGLIYFNDRVVNDVPPAKRNVAMVFQTFALYPHMTVFDNIAFPLKLRKWDASKIEKKVMEVAELLKIRPLLNRKPKELSGGQKQRVALGRALVREPDVFLMDEPLSNLDAKLRVEMRAELHRLHRELKITTIYVTHDQEEALTLGDTVAILKDGRLQQVGTPFEIYHKPATVFVADFIGVPPINLLEGKVSSSKTIKVDKFPIKVPSSLEKTLAKMVNEEVTVGIRPEDVKISKSKVAGSMPGKIEIIEPVGRELRLTLSAGGLTLRASVPPGQFRIGQQVWLRFNHVHLFDKSGRAIG
jgi:multiple sugar transport system ATP-binding protein